MRKIVLIGIPLCALAIAYCAKEDTRPVETVAWQHDQVRFSVTPDQTVGVRRCSETGDTQAEVLGLLIENPKCADEAIQAINRNPTDLGAAWLYRATRDQMPEALLFAYDASRKSTDEVRYNRARIFEKLHLPAQARAAWDEYLKHDSTSQWAATARAQKSQLRVVNGAEVWSREKARLEDALQRNDVATVDAIVREYSGAARRYFIGKVLHNESALVQPLAAPLDRLSGDSFCRDVIAAATRPGAVKDNALQLLTESDQIAAIVATSDDPQPALDAANKLRPRLTKYRYLDAQLGLSEALALTTLDRHLEAIATYDRARDLFTQIHDTAAVAGTIARTSGVYYRLGDHKTAWRLAHKALETLPLVSDPKEQNNIAGAAADAARAYDFPAIALEYQRANEERLRWSFEHYPTVPTVIQNYAICVRELADLELQLDQSDAQTHLQSAVKLSGAKEISESLRRTMQIQLLAAQSSAAFKKRDFQSAIRFDTEALNIAANDSSSVRAVLHQQRAAAYRLARNQEAADRDMEAMFALAMSEGEGLMNTRRLGEHEEMWSSYFARFGDDYREHASRLIASRDYDEALRFSEEARGFEPLSLILRRQNIPRAFETFAHTTDAAFLRAALPPDAVVIQYLVLQDESYAFIISRDHPIEVVLMTAGRDDIRKLMDTLQRSAVKDAEDPEAFKGTLSGPYTALIATPLSRALAMNDHPAPLVIIPDGPMFGLPFAALYDSNQKRYLIEYAPLTVAGSLRLFLYSWMRDAEMPRRSNPRVVLFGNPDEDIEGTTQAEVDRLLQLYGKNAVLRDKKNATFTEFLLLAPDADILNFSGHAVANAQLPFSSYLSFANNNKVTASRMLVDLRSLPHTRLAVLAACSSAGALQINQPIGPEGIAPLVRSFTAANVPAVLGTLWNVNDDDTTQELLVSFHSHYRNGDDVTVALQKAQLDMLRTKDALAWGGFQVVGYASSPFAPARDGGKTIEQYIRTQHSVQRPDGVRSQ